jgi:hypothetical protein
MDFQGYELTNVRSRGGSSKIHITKLCRRQAEVIQNHENEYVQATGQGEARHRKYKRLKLGGGQAYDISSDKAAVIA